MIPFSIPTFTGNETKYINQTIKDTGKICGDGVFTQKCTDWFEKRLNISKVLLTTSCTHSLEMTAILADIQEEDEVIMPSFTFVSTANAFVLRGAKVVFVDIRPDTMNIDETLIERAITEKTKAIVPVHYASVACEMDTIINIAKKYNLYVIEDSAQGMMGRYKGRALGTIGDFGCYSFHETKNYTMGEGGAILINNKKFFNRAEIIREKGTNRSQFFRGCVDKYSWMDIGSSYLPSELNAAYLYAQLEVADKINKNRLATWDRYYKNLKELKERKSIELPVIPKDCIHNAHIFYIKCKKLEERTQLIKYLLDNGIISVFHYIPLHTSKAGLKYGEFIGQDNFTTLESERLLRLPLFYNMKAKQIDYITKNIYNFYNND